MLWTSRLVSALPVLMLLLSSAMKLLRPPQVVEGFTHLGWSERSAIPLAIVEVGCTIIYLIPRTAVLGAVLLTGYMGGAIATHARLGEPFIVQALIGVFLWLGLYLRDPRLRALLPFN